MEEILNMFNEPSPNIVNIIGGNSEEEYNYLIKKIYELLTKRKNTLIFDGEVPIPTNFDIISLVQESVLNMNLFNIKDEDISLTSNPILNQKIKLGIDTVLQDAINKTSFKSQTIKNNFFIKEIVWIYEIVNKLNWSIDEAPLIVYYGTLSLEEAYLLKTLNVAGIKIVNINSMSNKNLLEGETIKFNSVLPFISIKVRVANAKEPEQINEVENSEEVVTTWAKQAKDEFDEQLYQNDSVFRPWTFRDGTTKSVNINAILEDIKIYIKEQARFRPEFKVEGKKVYVPNFMCKVNGVHENLLEYKDFVDLIKGQELTLFKTSCDNLVEVKSTNEDIYSLVFLMDDNKINFENAKIHKLYKINWVNLDTQKFIIKKLNDFIDIFINKLEMKTILSLISIVFDMNKDIAELIEQFDFPFNIPKLVIYEPRRNLYNDINSLFLIYLNMLGFDIILLSPVGTPMIEDSLYGKHLNIINLDKMKSDLDLNSILNLKPNKISSMFKKFFNK